MMSVPAAAERKEGNTQTTHPKVANGHWFTEDVIIYYLDMIGPRLVCIVQ